MAKRPTDIGSVMIHSVGSNPYVYARGGSPIGHSRVDILRGYRQSGVLPDGVALWDDRDREPITKPSDIDWSGMRD